MGWRDNLQKASFRGVEFKCESVDTIIGRRNILHEYPMRDIPYAEDLGKKAREISIRAYVIGDDYLAWRDRLIEAVEMKAEAGTLVHPTLGAILAVVKECRHGYSNKEGGIEYFDLTFAEAGEKRYPSAAIDTKSSVSTAASTLKNAVTQVFGRDFNIGGLPQFVSDHASGLISGSLIAYRASAGLGARNEASAQALFEKIDSIEANSVALLADPAQLAEEFTALPEALSGVYTGAAAQYKALAAVLATGQGTDSIPLTTTTRQTQSLNQTSFNNLLAGSLLGGLSTSVSNMSFDSYDDAIALRVELSGHFDAALNDTSDDAVYLALSNLRAAAIKDITSRAGTLERLQGVVLKQALPAGVLAYDLYEQAGRDTEISSRNQTRHPGFLPAGQELQVLTG